MFAQKYMLLTEWFRAFEQILCSLYFTEFLLLLYNEARNVENQLISIPIPLGKNHCLWLVLRAAERTGG